MSLYGMRELIDGIRTARAETIRIALDIPAEDYDFRPTPASRSFAATLVHIAWAWSFDRRVHQDEHLDSLEDFDFPALIAESFAEEAKPRSKQEIVDLLRGEGERY